MAVQIDGKLVSAAVRDQLKERITDLAGYGITPGLAVVIVGEDPASQTYVRGKMKACDQLGIYSEQYTLPVDTTQKELMARVAKLNEDEKIHGILVQLPLPPHLDEREVVLAIDPNKDVDAFHPYNVGQIMLGEYTFLPCTPSGILDLLDYYKIDVSGKHCVVIGRSNLVGKPMALLLLHRNATITICHSRTEGLAEKARQADILVVAVGRRDFLTGEMVKPGAVVIDVGINRKEDGKLCGDVNFAQVEPLASYITPVPGGVGPMTVTTLMKNTIAAAEKKLEKGRKGH